MGISPYISASIVLSFALAAAPELRAWRKDAGAAGTDVIAQLSRRIGLGISVLQALWTAYSMRALASPALAALPLGWYYALTVTALSAGTTSLMWLAEEITRTGIGQGTSVVISLSIVGAYASALRALAPRVLSGAVPPAAVAAVAAAVVLQTALAVLTVEGVRKVPIAFFQLQGGAGGANQTATALGDDHIPFRANPTGIQPVLFAVCLLDGLPWALSAMGAPSAAMLGVSALLSPERALYYALYFGVVFAFSFLDLEDTPVEVAEYILKVGARVPGVRPGDATVQHLRATQLATRAWGGLLLGALSTASMLADKWMHAAFGKSVGFTSMLIIVRLLACSAPALRGLRWRADALVLCRADGHAAADAAPGARVLAEARAGQSAEAAVNGAATHVCV
jgi:preprotein translocase subunit SecY